MLFNLENRKKQTIASEEPSMDHLVMSPFWMIKELDGDNGKRTTPSPPLDREETLAVASILQRIVDAANKDDAQGENPKCVRKFLGSEFVFE